MNLNPLIAALCAAAEVFGQTLTKPAAMMMAAELEAFPPEQVHAALRDCVRSLKGRLTLADILERLQADDGRPEPDEAWLLALAATNPSNRQPLTTPIRQAFQLAKSVLDMGDKIGARMGFLAAYRRLVEQARTQGLHADWQEPLKAKASQEPQNVLPQHEKIDKEQARDNLAQIRDFIRQTMTQAGEQQNKENEKRRAQLRAKAQHFAQLEQEARELKNQTVSETVNQQAIEA